MKRIFAVLLCLTMAFGVLAGCAGDTPDKTPEPAAPPAEGKQDPPPAEPAEPAEPETPSAPELSGTMKVVATSEAYVDLFDKFTEATGVKVELLSMSSGEVLSKLRAEGGVPSADLWFGGGIDAFMSAKA